MAEIEPNDAPAQAQLLTPGRHVEATLVAGEVDWFRFTLTAPAQVHVRTSGNFTANGSVDTLAAIYDAVGGARLAWDDNSDGSHSDCGVTLPAGNYTALVAGKLSTTAGAYGVDFAVLPVEPIDTNEASEPNGLPTAGGSPTPIALGDVVTGELLTANDVDWFTFTLAGRAIVQAVAYDDGGVPQLDQTRLQLQQQTGPSSWTPIGSVGQNSNSHRALTLTHSDTLAAGNYAIEVASSTSTAAGTAPWNYNKVGRYALRTRVLSLPGINTMIEPPEPNNAATAAANLGFGDAAAGNLSTSTDADWYRFSIGGPTTIGAICETGPAPSCTGTSLRLLNADGSLVTSAVGGIATHARLLTTLPVAGTYYVEVTGAVVATSGNYRLLLGSCEPLWVGSSIAVEPTATNACAGSNGQRPTFGSAIGERPFLGSSFVLRASNALPNTLVIAMAGLSNTTASGTPLPMNLGLFGAPGCFLRVDPLAAPGFISDGSGSVLIDLPLVQSPSVRGTTIYAQCLCLDPFVPGNTLGATVSNDLRLVVGDRTF